MTEGRPVRRHASGGVPDPWLCCGCGNVLRVDGTTGCNCATSALYRHRDDECMVKAKMDPTQFGDEVAEQMRAYFDAHKNDRWRRGTADNLMLGLLNVARRGLEKRQ